MTEFAPGAVLGIRDFLLFCPGNHECPYGDLCGPYMHISWKPGVNYARCLKSTKYLHPLADMRLDCLCGFYGLIRPGLLGTGYSYYPFVSGIIEGFGTVVLGEHGFRAEQARIVAIILPPWITRSRKDKVCSRYPGTEIFSSTELALESFPLGMLNANGHVPNIYESCGR
jgi:hypothetical protein